MAASDDRLQRWRQRRDARLRGLGYLRTQDRPDGPPAFYVADELLVRADHRAAAEDVLAQQGHHSVTERTAGTDFHCYRAPNLDVLAATAAIRHRAVTAGDSRPAASPNHVFLSTPFEHGGPYGPPMPAASALTLAAPDNANGVAVAVIDTGVWPDSPLPAGYYVATPADYESTVDANLDGILDGDVGHANFVAGVIAQGSCLVKIRIVKLLDTFGVCTEADLATALVGLDASIPLINLSLGGYTVDDAPPIALRDALNSVLSTGDRLVVAAAGNDGQHIHPFWPAAFAGSTETWHDRVGAVAAHDGQHLCSWSNTGTWVSLAAPGLDVCSTYVLQSQFSNGWAQWSGTSFATPYVIAAVVTRLGAAGSVTAAWRAVRDLAAGHSYDGFPGLP
jgi:thermitase